MWPLIHESYGTHRSCDKVNKIVPIMQKHFGPVKNHAILKLSLRASGDGISRHAFGLCIKQSKKYGMDCYKMFINEPGLSRVCCIDAET